MNSPPEVQIRSCRNSSHHVVQCVFVLFSVLQGSGSYGMRGSGKKMINGITPRLSHCCVDLSD